MTVSGRKPTPAMVKNLKGNTRLRGHTGTGVDGIGEIGEPPADWPSDLQAIWMSIVASAPPGVLTGSDRHLVGVVVKLLHQFHSSEHPGPALGAEVRRGLAELGLTPAERNRLSAPALEKEENPFLALKRDYLNSRPR